jgi:hypothetical protein
LTLDHDSEYLYFSRLGGEEKNSSIHVQEDVAMEQVENENEKSDLVMEHISIILCNKLPGSLQVSFCLLHFNPVQ